MTLYCNLTYKQDAYLLNVNLNVLLQAVAVEIQHEVMHKVEAVTHDDEGQLVLQLGFLQEVLHALRVVAVGLAADALHLLDLASLASRLESQTCYFSKSVQYGKTRIRLDKLRYCLPQNEERN